MLDTYYSFKKQNLNTILGALEIASARYTSMQWVLREYPVKRISRKVKMF